MILFHLLFVVLVLVVLNLFSSRFQVLNPLECSSNTNYEKQ